MDLNGNCQEKILKLLLWTRRRQVWRPGPHFFCHRLGKICSKDVEIALKCWETKWFFSKEFFLQTALPSIYIVVSKNMLVAVCRKPEVFFAKSETFENHNFLSKGNCTSKFAPGLANCNFVSTTRFFLTLIRRFFFSVRRDQKTNSWLFFKNFSPSGCSSMFVKCNEENVTEVFCQSSAKEWFKSSWSDSDVGKEVFHEEISLQTALSGTWSVVFSNMLMSIRQMLCFCLRMSKLI